MEYSTATSNPARTQALAARLAGLLHGGEVIELAGDLGGGKTTFVQGLVAALGYAGRVSSPTFTLSNIYRLDDGREIHHFDLYRLNDGGVAAEELFDDVADPKVITVVEWAAIIEAGLPADRLRITFMATGEDDRELAFIGSGERSNALIKGLAS